MNILKYSIPILFLLIFNGKAFSDENCFLTAKPKKGDGISTFLKRYGLPAGSEEKKSFIDINSGRLTKRNGLVLGRHYQLPILKVKFNGKTIRSCTGIVNFDSAKAIQDYNDKLAKRRIKDKDFRIDKVLWVPQFLISVSQEKNIPEKSLDCNESGRKINAPDLSIFGEANSKLIKRDTKLNGAVFYLVAGHGGPDPGAVGTRGKYTFSEDEYAYDVTLRLGKRLLEHGATVHFIVQDPNDGIRSGKYLELDYDEYYLGGDTISADQLERLAKRVEIINKEYQKSKKKSKYQRVVVIHVDSRTEGKKIDIFFYHNPGSLTGEKFAKNLQQTIRKKYAAAQPGRGYGGTVSSRGLYLLRKTNPVCVYIELGNIQNSRDQLRFFQENNRQAIANWLAEGLIEDFNQK